MHTPKIRQFLLPALPLLYACAVHAQTLDPNQPAPPVSQAAAPPVHRPASQPQPAAPAPATPPKKN